MIEKINSPHDVKQLPLSDLSILAAEVRNLIITTVSNQGGHLASSLGAVELCIALHYCLETPYDSVIFDVGHQTYAHKIITGRRDAFSSLRQHNGISGFPNFRESPYDIYISGHASTAVSWAQGLAEAKKMRNDESKTVAIIGDGSLTGGMCFEALNNCGHTQSEILIIVNHNEMSISPSVGALSSYLNKIISAPVYNRIRGELETFLSHFSLGKKLANHARHFEETIKGLIVPGIFFEELGFRYFGPIDGHNFETLIPTLNNVVSLKGPRVLHVVTKKGKGFEFSEKNPEYFHSAPCFCTKNGECVKEKQETFSESFAHALIGIAQKDERVVAITAAMPQGTGLDIFGKTFPQRLFDVGIAEEHAVGFASGLAKGGLRPYVAVYSTFLQRAFDQIIHDVALQQLPVTFILDRAGVVGEDGPTHHGVFDIGYLRIIPHMVCMAPKDKEELEDMLEFSLTLNKPASIRFPRGTAYSLENRQKVSLGKAQIMRSGKQVWLVALGTMVKTACEMSDRLAREHIECGVINARFIKPLDEELFFSLARKNTIIVTLEDGALCGGIGGALLELYETRGVISKAKIIRAGFPDDFIPAASREELFRMYGLDADSLVERIKKEIGQEAVWQKQIP
ncbi:MAG: 1-deoxy-D-xylulose-5-phosphate synthase [Candidatus Omnitrophica bacterium]|nr:1-deoxy-D-xylulose-5-phosphate synthase [Candidatus Omnitrophota bacterium]